MPFILDQPSSLIRKLDPQNASPFFNQLPGELRNRIYALAMTSHKPVIDPKLPCTSVEGLVKATDCGTKQHRVPALSIQLLRTCKRMYTEISMAPLYGQNVFRFTTCSGANKFLVALRPEYRMLIQDIEIDLRGGAVIGNGIVPSVEHEWIKFLSISPEDGAELGMPAKTRNLAWAAPNLKTLRLNIEAWKVQEPILSIALIREMLAGPRNLERVVMAGLDGSELLFGSRDRYLQRWGPVAFVGVMRFARLAGMVDWLAECVRGEKEEKVVVWEKSGRRIALEIMTIGMPYTRIQRRLPDTQSQACPTHFSPIG